MKLFGIRHGRWKEWIRAVWVGSADLAGFGRNVVKMWRGMRAEKVPKSVWKNRLKKGCGKCPIFSGLKHGKVCRLKAGELDVGCGCYVPFKVVVKAPYSRGCWGRENDPEGKMGWGI